MKNNRIVIVLLVIIIGILLAYGSYTTIELKKEPVQPHVETNYDSVDVKINHAIDSILKAVSKTDGQIIDMYLEQQEYIGELEKQITGLEVDIRNLRSQY